MCPFLLRCVRPSLALHLFLALVSFVYNMSKIFFSIKPPSGTRKHVENNGFEPLTPCLQSRCSSQLS